MTKNQNMKIIIKDQINIMQRNKRGLYDKYDFI